MLTEMQNSIIETLELLEDENGNRLFADIGIWNDDVNSMLLKPRRLPAAMVTLGAGKFTGDDCLNASNYNITVSWDVFVIFESLRLPSVVTPLGIGYLESVINALKGKRLNSYAFVPNEFELTATIDGRSAYMINFTIDERM